MNLKLSLALAVSLLLPSLCMAEGLTPDSHFLLKQDRLLSQLTLDLERRMPLAQTESLYSLKSLSLRGLEGLDRLTLSELSNGNAFLRLKWTQLGEDNLLEGQLLPSMLSLKRSLPPILQQSSLELFPLRSARLLS